MKLGPDVQAREGVGVIQSALPRSNLGEHISTNIYVPEFTTILFVSKIMLKEAVSPAQSHALAWAPSTTRTNNAVHQPPHPSLVPGP